MAQHGQAAISSAPAIPSQQHRLESFESSDAQPRGPAAAEDWMSIVEFKRRHVWMLMSIRTIHMCNYSGLGLNLTGCCHCSFTRAFFAGFFRKVETMTYLLVELPDL